MVLYYMTKWEEASLCLQAVLLDFSVLRSGVRLHKNRVFKPQVMIYPAHTDSQPRWGQLLSRLAGRGVASSMTAAHCHCQKSWSPVWLEACHLQVGWDPIFILAAPLREEEAGSHLFFFFFSQVDTSQAHPISVKRWCLCPSHVGENISSCLKPVFPRTCPAWITFLCVSVATALPRWWVLRDRLWASPTSLGLHGAFPCIKPPAPLPSRASWRAWKT